MKKVLMLAALPLIGLVSCQKETGKEIALVTDVGSLTDGSFNEGTWNGVKEYAEEHKISYEYYQPANGVNATEADRITAMNTAIDNGAKIIVTPGFMQEGALKNVAPQNPDVKFVFVDGFTLGIDNVTAVSYKEQESGYMAGYAAVKEGYKKLGGTFGGGGSNPACNRFAYGYVQGINDAAKDVQGVECQISFKYGSSFSPSDELQSQISGWYTSGTEVVFACGGGMVNSVKAASDGATKDGKTAKIIGVDVDQKGLSNQVITSATKGLTSSVKIVLGQIYDDKWDSVLKNKGQQLGAAEDSTGIAYHEDRLTKFKKADYEALLKDIKDGKVSIKTDGTSEDIDKAEFWSSVNTALANVTVSLDK